MRPIAGPIDWTGVLGSAGRVADADATPSVGALDWSDAVTGAPGRSLRKCGCAEEDTGGRARPTQAQRSAKASPGAQPGTKGGGRLPVAGPVVGASGFFPASTECDNAGENTVVTRGHHLGDFDSLDQYVIKLMGLERIPNAALGVMDPNGRLVLAHGYTLCNGFPPDGGVADAGDGSRGFDVYFAMPNSKFRIGSISKLLTAVTVLSMAEDKLFDGGGINTPVVDVMGRLYFRRARNGGRLTLSTDSYREQTTIGDLLRHLDPWCERSTGNSEYPTVFGGPLVVNSSGLCVPNTSPTTWDQQIVTANLGALTYPIATQDIREAMNLVPSTFAPGTVFSYSNYGYMLLGEIIEHVTGLPYEEVVRRRVLKPLGMNRTTMGRTRYAERQRGEVEYYDDEGLPINGSISSATPGYGKTVLEIESDGTRPRVYDPYGARFNLANSKPAGGWTSTVVDMLLLFRDIAQLGPSGGSVILGDPASFVALTTPSDTLLGSSGAGDTHYTMGLYVDRSSLGGAGSMSVGGTLPSGGSSGLACLGGTQWCYAFLFNKTARDPSMFWRYDLDRMEDDLVASVTTCTDPGTEDLFDRYTATGGGGSDAESFSWRGGP